MKPSADRRSRQVDRWTLLLNLGVTTCLAVLFGVLLTQLRGQSNRIGDLDQRLDGLEELLRADRPRARNVMLEDQLENLQQRLRDLEASGSPRPEAESILERRIEALERRLISDGSGQTLPEAPPPLPPIEGDAVPDSMGPPLPGEGPL
jgi:hypothetical protein